MAREGRPQSEVGGSDHAACLIALFRAGPSGVEPRRCAEAGPQTDGLMAVYALFEAGLARSDLTTG